MDIPVILTGADQINGAIQQLNQVTQENASSSEELATTSEELANQAEKLRELTLFFKLRDSNGDGRNAKDPRTFTKFRGNEPGKRNFTANPVRNEGRKGSPIRLTGAENDVSFENF